MNDTPMTMAAHLATYISDPSTIRVRVMDYFGRAPSVEQCRNLRAAHIKRAEREAQRSLANERYRVFRCDHEPTDDNVLLLESGNETCRLCHDANTKAAKAIAAEAERERKVREDKWRRGFAERRAATTLPFCPSWYHPSHDRPRVRIKYDTLQAVADAFGISIGELIGSERQKGLVDARAVAAKLFRDSGMSLPSIARTMNRACHSTIKNLCDTWPERVRRNPVLLDVYTRLRLA